MSTSRRHKVSNKDYSFNVYRESLPTNIDKLFNRINNPKFIQVLDMDKAEHNEIEPWIK
jgi:hypothetical protein